MNSENRAILLGMAIGDGHICAEYKPGAKLPFCKICIEHTIKNLDYVEYKAQLLREIFNSPYPIVHVRTKKCSYDKTKDYIYGRIDKGHTYLRVLRNWLYKDNKKVISGVLHHLNDHSIAMWYMDDGSTRFKYDRKGIPRWNELTIHLHEPLDEVGRIIDYFKTTWNVVFKPLKKKEDQYNIRCGDRETKKFFKIVSQYMLPSMMYKIRTPEETINLHERPTSELIHLDDDIVRYSDENRRLTNAPALRILGGI